MRRFVTILALAAVSLIFMVSDARAAQQVSRTFNMPVQLQAAIQAIGCNNSPGPQITMAGDLSLAGLGVDLTFTNNVKGTHTYSDGFVVNQVLVPSGQTITIPKQPVVGGVGGNPFIWMQLTDSTGHALTSEIFLGRCVQGQFNATANLAIPVTATAEVSASDCSNNPGPYITMNGAMEISGLNGRMIFRNNDNPVGGPHQADQAMSIDMVILPAGQTIQFPKQPVLGGVGGNPWISLLFRQTNGDAIGTQTLLGRCVQLSQ